MTGEIKLAIGLALAAGAAVGIGYAVSSSSPASSSPPASIPPGTPATSQGALIPFKRATGTIAKGQAVAVSIAQSDLQTVTAAAGLTPDVDGLVTLLSGPTSVVPALIGTSSFILYDPGTPLPPSWPKDDPSPSTEYHLSFVAGVDFDPTKFPIPAIFWSGSIPNS